MEKAKQGPGGLWYAQVDGVEYSFEKWGAELSLDTLAELGDLFGDALGVALAQSDSLQAAASSMKLGALAGDSVTATFVGMFTAKMRKNKKSVLAVLKLLTSGAMVCCKGQAVNFDLHYQDRLDHMFRVAAQALQVQYGNFINAVQRMLPELDGKNTSTASTLEPTASTG